MIAPASSLPNHFESFESGHLEKADVFAPPAPNSPGSSSTVSSNPAVYGSAVSEPVAVRKPVRPKTMPVSEDPFAPPIMDDDLDPFASPTSINPASTGADPFAAPLTPAMDLTAPEATQADPFAAYGGSAGSKAVQDDLPKQARRARDRAVRRTSVRTQTLLSLIVPLLTVVVVLVGYLLYAMPRQMTRLVTDRTLTLSTSVASQLFRPLSLGQTQNVESIVWQGRADGRASFVYVIAPDNTTILGKAADAGVNRDAVDGIWASDRVALEAQGGIIRAGETEYVASVSPILDGSGKRVGSVFAGLEASIVWNEMWSVLTPIFVVLLIVFGAASAIATALSASLLRPIFAATEQANRISLGDLDRRIESTSNDEIGDLLSSLERMRLSLKSMVARLRRNQENP